ncbi:type I-E CRISPR-associated protein Cas6/Cse3/CasE [Streptomyces sodiiphilus]|uniref:Type I-E CRISPR-associated protein Cas6/Cse3/CasE n=1 Tax=Streptomyces sodiiphilus TaxID=226217 RepID=A0ABP5AXR9_9ACTN
MHLTRFRFNTARAGARRLLSSPQRLHAAVMAGFPDLLPGDTTTPGSPRVLWRADHNARAEVLLYIVSPTAPDLTHLVEQAGWPAAAQPGWKTHDYASFLARLTPGSTWNFRLTANPVHSIRREDGEPTKRTAHRTPHHQVGWLVERQDALGIRLLERPAHLRGPRERHEHLQVVVHDRHRREFDKTTAPGQNVATGPDGRPQARKRNRVTMVTATFDGLLEVTDPDALRHTLTTGVGRGKAYGCGLMTLAPAPDTAPAGATS